MPFVAPPVARAWAPGRVREHPTSARKLAGRGTDARLPDGAAVANTANTANFVNFVNFVNFFNFFMSFS